MGTLKMDSESKKPFLSSSEHTRQSGGGGEGGEGKNRPIKVTWNRPRRHRETCCVQVSQRTLVTVCKAGAGEGSPRRNRPWYRPWEQTKACSAAWRPQAFSLCSVQLGLEIEVWERDCVFVPTDTGVVCFEQCDFVPSPALAGSGAVA